MNKIIIIATFLLLFAFFHASAQEKSKFSLAIDYGLNGNFFVRSYDELGGPTSKTYFYKKDFLGTIAGIEAKYQLNEMSCLGLGYARSINKGKKNFEGFVGNVLVEIQDFELRHINDFFQCFYERKLSKKLSFLSYHGGIFYVIPHQQEIGLENFSNRILIDERNQQNSNLNEAGIFAGIGFSKKIDNQFELGIRARVYYILTAGYFENITLTPTLTYYFKKKRK